MVKAKKKIVKKVAKKSRKVEEEKEEDEEEENEGGMDLDDAFGDDEDVEYAESKPRKLEPKIVKAEVEEAGEVKIVASKPIGNVKKGDKVKVDGLILEVDSHYVLIDHGSTREMAIELFDPKTEKDYQLRYFDDRVESSIEFFVLEEIVYNRKHAKKIEW